MNKYLKSISKSKILQFILIADSLVIHVQSYIASDYVFLIIGLTLTCIHILLLGLEHICSTRKTLLLIIIAIKSSIQIIVGYTFLKDWLIFTGLQVALIIKQEQHKFVNLITLLSMLAQIVCITLGKSNQIAVGIVRSVINYLLISLIFKQKQTCNFTCLSNILLNIQHDEFCLLNMDFEPIYEQNLLNSIIEEQVSPTMDSSNLSRIFTPRDNTTQMIRQSNCQEEFMTRPSFLVKEIIQQIKKNHLKLDSKLYYEPTNQSNYYYSIQKIKTNDEDHFIMISKHKQIKIRDNLKQAADQVQVMIKTVHKISHDMRNPLNAIINMQMCLKDLIDPSLVQKFLKPSLNSCHLLLNLLNDILDAAQVENKTIRLSVRKFNLVKLIEKTISLFDLVKEKKELQITFNYDQKLPQKINSDKLRIRQVVMNLLSNAIKYTQPKGSILIECFNSQEKQDSIVISLQDSGMGIKSENLQFLFKEFSKVDDAENHKLNPMGIGLGLMISNELAKLLSSSTNKQIGIQVKSEYGVGSKFYFEVENFGTAPEDLSESQISHKATNRVPTQELHFLQSMMQQKSPTVSLAIPMLESSKRITMMKQLKPYNYMTSSLNYQATLRIRNESERNLSNKPSIQGRLIQALVAKWNELTHYKPPVLIVDDDETNIMVLHYLLQSMEISSDSAMSGMISIQKVTERVKDNSPYQLVFMDIEMPGMNGYDTTQKLIKLDQTLTIVACSGDNLNCQTQDQLKNQGFMGAVRKPITKLQLKEIFVKLSDQIRSDSQLISYFN